MNYWWVSQNQTHRQEIGGNYMWSPKADKNGKSVQSYTNMTKVSVGDLVFAFYQSKVQSIGIVMHPAVTSPKPEDFGSSGDYWANIGWMVAVSWMPLPKPMAPKQHIQSLVPFLPQKHSPIRSDGTGNQAYLFSVGHLFAEKILSITGLDQNQLDGLLSVGDGAASALQQLEDDIEQTIINDTTIDQTEKDALVKSRRGQGKFKSNLKQIEKSCRLTGVDDIRFLIASHIKAWSECSTNEERLDGYNGLLLCPNADKLFDKGFISFTDEGDLLVSSQMEKSLLESLGIDPHKNVGDFAKEQKHYLKHHREHVFKV